MTRVPPRPPPVKARRHPVRNLLIVVTVLLLIPSTRPVVIGWAGDALEVTGQVLGFLAGGLIAALVLLTGTPRRR